MTKEIKKYFSLFQQLSQLAIPLAVAQIAHMGMQVVDTLMMGQLGPAGLAVGALGGVIIYNISVFCIGILSATGTLLAQAYGAKDYSEMGRVLCQSILLSILFSIVCIAIIQGIPDVLLRFGLDKTLLLSTKIFLSALSWGAPSWLIFFVLRDYISVMGSARIVMIISIGAIPANAFLNYILMYGKLGFPVLGIAGIGYSTSIVRWGMLVTLILYIFFHKNLWSYLTLSVKNFLSLNKMKKILVLGCPTGLMMGLEIGMFSLTTMMMAHFGVVALAAHQIAIQWANVVFTIPLGISQAASIQVGKAVGAKQTSLVRPIDYLAVALGSLFAVVIAAFFYYTPVAITRLFLDINHVDNFSVKLLAISYLAMAALLQFLDSAQVITMGALRGMGDTFMPMLLGIAAYWLVGLSGGYVLAFIYHWEGRGLWWGLCLGIGVSTALLMMRFNKLTTKGNFLIAQEIA